MLIREFHPVGQGAFYTEKHKYGKDGNFTIVYDCGSTTKGNALKEAINSTFECNNIIDVLFISHFHEDHINGVKRLSKKCEIKNVVLPLLDESEKIWAIAKILCEAESEKEEEKERDALIQLIIKPKDFFNEGTKITVVNPSGDNNQNSINLQDPEDPEIPEKIQSGTKLSIKKQDLIWCFIPINYKNEERKNILKEKTQDININNVIEDIKSGNQTTINKIKEVYKNIDKETKKDLNTTSMLLFSGIDKNEIILSQQNLKSCSHSNAGCLYTGDANLCEELIEELKRILKNFFPYIGTLQVPHHGSTRSYNRDIPILLEEIRYAVISYGTKNKYKHPSCDVICDLIKHRLIPFCVTEDKNTKVTQEIK